MQREKDGSSGIRELLQEYYDGVAKGGGWGHLLSEDFLLTGTVAKESRGRDPYVNNGFFKMVKALQLKEQVTEGESAFTIVRYDLVSPKGKAFASEVAELWRMKDGKLHSVAIYFDTAAFERSMAQ